MTGEVFQGDRITAQLIRHLITLAICPSASQSIIETRGKFNSGAIANGFRTS
jgi:hypothetical protein